MTLGSRRPLAPPTRTQWGSKSAAQGRLRHRDEADQLRPWQSLCHCFTPWVITDVASLQVWPFPPPRNLLFTFQNKTWHVKFIWKITLNHENRGTVKHGLESSTRSGYALCGKCRMAVSQIPGILQALSCEQLSARQSRSPKQDTKHLQACSESSFDPAISCAQPTMTMQKTAQSAEAHPGDGRKPKMGISVHAIKHKRFIWNKWP